MTKTTMKVTPILVRAARFENPAFRRVRITRYEAATLHAEQIAAGNKLMEKNLLKFLQSGKVVFATHEFQEKRLVTAFWDRELIKS